MNKKQRRKWAKKHHKDVRQLLGLLWTREDICVKYHISREDFDWMVKNLEWFAFSVELGEMKAYADDIATLRRLMQDKECQPSLVKLYMAARHGVTDKVDRDIDDDSGPKTPVLNVIVKK